MKLGTAPASTNWRALLISIAIAEGVGVLSSLLTMNAFAEYQKLNLPPWSPPGWLFAPVWIVLYALMGWAAYRIWSLGRDSEEVRSALGVYVIQLVLNFLWTPLFFGLQLRGLAFAEILLLLIAIIITTVKFYRLDKFAGYLMIPYLLWVAFAAVLNYSVWQLNM